LRAAGRWLLAHGFSPRPDAAALSLLALKHCPAADETALRAAVDRPTRWLETSQSKDGGWISPAATGLVLEALCAWGRTAKHPSVRRAIGFLLGAQQDCDGSWPGPPGAGYLHATCFALRGLRAAGHSDHEVAPLRATEWLRSAQNAAGGWGENLASAAAPGFQEAPSTVPHTAQAVLGLLAGGDNASESVRRGVEYLLGAQREDGSWPGGQPPSASGGTGSSWKNRGLPPFPQTQLVETTTNVDVEMAGCPHFSSALYCCHRPLGVLALAEYLRTRGER
jgi:squalene-hopene/tetraprenyl-beta-curcumene cyclase